LTTAFRPEGGDEKPPPTVHELRVTEHARQIDENEALPYKPRQLSAMTRLDRGGSFGPEMALSGPTSITGFHLINRQIARSAENHP
jgi:hypothetical protein